MSVDTITSVVAAAGHTGAGASPLVTNLAILVLAGFVGYAVISKRQRRMHPAAAS